MAQSGLLIDDRTLTQIFKGSPRQFGNLARATLEAAYLPGIRDPPRNEYPLFEHLMIWLYGRWISPSLSKTTLLGSSLSNAQKTNLGEALDYLLYSNFLPLNSIAELGQRVSLLSLCYHEKFGFRDDPVLLQRMWYIRAYVLLEDSPNGAGEGERWKWFDYRLALVIYSWVRHNRKYHGCPKVSCHCRQLIDLYGLSIGTFKTLYMSLEKQCVSQLQFVRSSEPVWSPAPGSTSRSRADDIKLYFIPNRKIWPHCFSTCVTEPDPIPRPAASPSALTPVIPSSAALQAAPPNPHSALAAGPSSLPPPHPSLPARPTPFTPASSVLASIKGNAHSPVQAMTPIISSDPTRHPNGSTWSGLSGQPAELPPLQPPTVPPPPQPRDSPPPPPPPPQGRSVSTSLSPTRQTAVGGRLRGANPDSSPTRTTAQPASSSQTSNVSKEFVTAPSTPASTAVTPILAPVVPAAARAMLGPPSRSITGMGSSPQGIPSAPRSMREVKGASSGPIPTGPRALTGVAKATGVAPNVSKFPIYAGIPSAPRSMRGLLAKGTAMNVGSDGVGPRAHDKEGMADPKVVEDDRMSVDEVSVASGITHTSIPPAPKSIAESVASESSTKTQVIRDGNGSVTHILQHSPPPILNLSKPSPPAPRVVPPMIGKRSRSDTKADEIQAQMELDAKAKSATGPQSDKARPSTPTMTTTPPVAHAPPSLPPAKRVKPLLESESPTAVVTKTFMTRKPLAKDGVAILAAVSKQKNGTVGRVTTQGKDMEVDAGEKVASEKVPTVVSDAGSQKAREKPNTNVLDTSSRFPQARSAGLALNESVPRPQEVEKAGGKKKASISPPSNAKKAVMGSEVAASGVSPDKAPKPHASQTPVPTSTGAGASTTDVAMGIPNGVTEENGASKGQKEIAARGAAIAQTKGGGKGNSKKAASLTVSPPSSNSQKQKEIATGAGNDEEMRRAHAAAEKVIPRTESTRKQQEVTPEGTSAAGSVNRKPARTSRAKKTKQGVDEVHPTEETQGTSSSGPRSLPERHKDNEKHVDDDQREAEAPEVNGTRDSISADGSSPTKQSQGKSSAAPLSEIRPKRKAAKKGKPETPSRSKSKQAVAKASKAPDVTKTEIIELSSDESVVPDVSREQAQQNAIDVQPPSKSPTVLRKVANINGTSTTTSTASKDVTTQLDNPDPAARIGQIAATLQSGTPFPTVLIRAADPEKRRQTAQHEASRLMCALIAVGVQIDWWMIGVTENGFVIRDEASPLVIPLLTEAILTQLHAIGIAVEASPAEACSEEEEEDTSMDLTFNPRTFPSRMGRDESLPIVLFDGQGQRRLRSEEAEERRLRGLVDGILGRALLEISVEKNAFDTVGPEEVVCLICPKEMNPPLRSEEISRLGLAGLYVTSEPFGAAIDPPYRVVHQGNVQLAGPLPVGSSLHSRSQSNGGSFDWRAMRTEVLKMKLPWEMGNGHATPPTTSLYSPSTPTHSSFTEAEESPANAHFRQLLRPNLWSASGTFSKMAAAGMRWGEFSGVDPDSSDEFDDDEEPGESSLGTVIRA